MSTKKCTLCDKRFVDKEHLVRHIDKSHGSQIPQDWTASRYENYLRTGRTHGTCVICKRDTDWNEVTGKYCRMCGSQACRDRSREIAEDNLIKKKGVTHSQMLKDPEFQRKMVYSKETSGAYLFDGYDQKVMYDSTYGLDFLEMLDYFMNFPGCDIAGPSPNTYVYMYKGEKKLYIPDFYIYPFNLEIEIKDGGDNPNKHPKIQAVDKEKEKLKDAAMKKEKVNYVKIVNKNYSSFFRMLLELKNQDDSSGNLTNKGYIAITESTSPSIDSDSSIILWAKTEMANIQTDYDITSFVSKLDALINQLKATMNNQDDVENKYKTFLTINNLEEIKKGMEKKMVSI